jgi:hypothetical protein
MKEENVFGGRRKGDGKTTRRYGLYLIAFLDLHGVNSPLSEQDGVVYFETADDEKTRRLSRASREDELVPVLQFASSLQKVRKRLFEAKKNISPCLPAASATRSGLDTETQLYIEKEEPENGNG